MDILKYFYSKRSVKRKILDIKSNIKDLIKTCCSEKFDVIWYGSYDIDPKNLIYWICIESDKVKHQLENNVSLNEKLRSLLTKNNYPEQAQQHVGIGFESQETVDKESGGNWHVHSK